MTLSHHIQLASKWKFGLLILVMAIASTVPAYGDTGSEIQSDDLNDQIQAIKNEAIKLTSKLNRLEEKLLYPAHTQVSIFVSMAKDSKSIPRAVSLKIDDKTVTHHIYTEKEIQALLLGGIQRLYTGNTKMGKHKLSVTLKESINDDDVRNSETRYSFNKSEKIKFIELNISRNQAKDKRITFRDWN